MKKLSLGISSCPNDTFIFAALITGLVPSPFKFDLVMDDVEVLNQLALDKKLDVVKVSYGVLGGLLDDYQVLPTGGAMGFGVGPLILAKAGVSLTDENIKVAVPGLNTTAYKVFSIFYPHLSSRCTAMRFDKIMPAVKAGEYDVGIVIHEGRFTYPEYGLVKIGDIGEMWQGRYDTPLPLGAILIKKDLYCDAKAMNNAIKESLNFARQHPSDIMPFVEKYSDEMSADVMKSHIELYVNDYSIDARRGADGIARLLGVPSTDIFADIGD